MNDPVLIVAAGALALAFCMGALRMHAFLSLLAGSATVFLLTSPELATAYHVAKGVDQQTAEMLVDRSLAENLNTAFGTMAARLGLLIALASIVAEGLFHSGAAQAIIRALIRRLGERRAPAAFTIGSFTLGIPAFSDTVLYLMLPLARSTAVRTGGGYLGLVLVIAIAATTTHGLVPPTPGPLFAAAAFNLDLGFFIPLAILVSACAVVPGFIGARWIDSRASIPVRPTPGISEADMASISSRSDEGLPPLWLSLTPLLLPLALISAASFTEASGDTDRPAARLVAEIGDPVIAMAISAAFAMGLLARYGTGGRRSVSRHVSLALQGAGAIILITVAGGIFGVALQSTNIGSVVADMASGSGTQLLLIAFALGAFFSLSTGSGTVAVITGAGVLASVVEGQTLPYYAGYIALALGSGSKVFPWMNNSYFWLLCEAGGLTAREALRYFSTLNTFVALCGLLSVLCLSHILPLI